MGTGHGQRYHLSDGYHFEGFHPQEGKVRGVLGKPQAHILPLERRSSKTCCGECGTVQTGFYDTEIKRIRDLPCGGGDDMHMYLEIEFRRVLCQKCGKLQSERIEWLGDDHLYTKRFSKYVGKRCLDASIQSVAKDFELDLDTVEEMSKNYMR